MNNEYEYDDNSLSSLPKFGPVVEKQKEADVGAKPVWESEAMAGVRADIEAKARELGVSRHDVLSAGTDLALREKFFDALAEHHGLPGRMHGQPLDIHLDSKPGAVQSALDALKALDAAEPVTPLAAAAHDAADAPGQAAEAASVSSPGSPSAATEPTAKATEQAAPQTSKKSEPEGAATPRDEMDILSKTAAKVLHQTAGAEVNPDDLAQMSEVLAKGGSAVGVAAPRATSTTIGDATAQAAHGLVSAGAQLIGGVVKGTTAAIRDGIKSAVGSSKPGAAADVSVRERPRVFPNLSEYRVQQLERQVNEYSAAQEAFWKAGKMPDVRKAVEERARETGMSVEDVVEKMKPGGEMEDLHDRFVEAVAASPETIDPRKAMSKAIDSFVRQYDRAQEELQAPEQEGSKFFPGLKDRVGAAKDNLLKKAGHTPLFDGEEMTHLEKVRQAVAKIIEKMKEVAAGFINMIRGKDASVEAGATVETSNEPSP